jgi:recombination protein RecA
MGRRKSVDEPEVVKTASGSSIILDLVKYLQSESDVDVGILGDDTGVIANPKFLPTGLPIIDHMLGGGIPAGRLTELFSKGQGLGKSSLVARLMVEMQAQGGEVILMDTEHGFTNERLEQLGVDLNRVIKVQPEYIEQGASEIKKILKFLKNSKTKREDKTLIVWDSITASPSKQEFEAEYGDMQIASAARAWSSIIKILKDQVARSEVYIVLVNQTRTNIMQMFGEKQKSTGGIAIKYYVGASLVLSRGANAWLKEGPQRVGFKVTMMTEKSRVAAPYRVAEAHFLFDSGYDRWRALFDLLIKLHIIKVNGAWYELSGVSKSFQAKQFETVITSLSDPFRKEVIEALREARITPEGIAYFFPDE